MKRIVVLGGNGFLGRALARSVINQLISQYEITCLDKSLVNLAEPGSAKELLQLLMLLKPHVVIQLACIKRQSADSKDIYKLNNLISHESAAALARLDTKVIYLSSCAVFGEKNQQEKYIESSMINPTSFYGAHKADSEKIYQDSLDTSNLIILRPPLIYSMYQDSGYHPGKFVSEAFGSNRVQLWGKGTEKREFININDAVNVILGCARLSTSGIINLVSGRSYSYINLVNHIAEYKHLDLVCRERSGPLVDHSYSSSKLKQLFPNYDFLSPFTAIDLYFQSLIL